MGTEFRIVLYAPDEAFASLAARAAFDRIAELDGILSDYAAGSELNRLSAGSGQGAAVTVSDDLWRVLERSLALSRESGGAFDITVGPIVRLWRRATSQRELPKPRRLETALEATGHEHVVLDPEKQSVLLERPGMRLDVGGIAKGYAAAEALAVLKKLGISRALVDAGGDMALGAPPPGRAGWRIALAPFEGEARETDRYVELRDCGVATSGDTYRYVEIDGIRYSHIVDPRTGFGLTTHSSITVIAPDATTADALASALSVMEPARGLELIEQRPGVRALVRRLEAGGCREYRSSSWEDRSIPAR